MSGLLLVALSLFYFALSVLTTCHILLHKNDVKSAIGWIGLVWLSPVIGALLYMTFGINTIARKAQNLHGVHLLDERAVRQISPDKLTRFDEELLRFLYLGYKIYPQAFSFQNDITPLLNGDEAYPVMCAHIAAARREVLLSSYIFNNDTAGELFLNALAQAARNGAKVKVLVDGVGVRYSWPNILKSLTRIKGIQTASFLPSRAPIQLPFLNLRNHKKLLVVDGKTAFMGGMNIAAGNLLKTHPKKPIADVTFQIKGPLIKQISDLFADDWHFATGKKFTPVTVSVRAKGTTAARVITSGPDHTENKMELMLISLIASAKKRLVIVTPYFLPDRNILDILGLAAMSGVIIDLIIPHKSNIFGMDWAMASHFDFLLKKGIRIYQSWAPFDHSKLFLIDDSWALIGSSNWDVRSLRLNFESNIECIGADLVHRLEQIVQKKKRKARRLQKRDIPVWQKLRNNLFRLLTPYY